MEQQYGSDFISITDEDGKEYELEILSTIEYQGAEYLALVPQRRTKRARSSRSAS